jgi:hypothetical protein
MLQRTGRGDEAECLKTPGNFVAAGTAARRRGGRPVHFSLHLKLIAH